MGLDITSREETEKDLIVPLPGHDCVVSVIAEGATGVSDPATIRISWKGEMETVTKPKLYLLAIGINDYTKGLKRLSYASKDAEDFAKAMKRQKGGIYKEVIVKSITNTEATKDHILGGLDWLEKEATSRDVVMLFFAGHGMNERGIYYFLPVDADPNQLKQTALPYTEIKNTVGNLPGKVVLFVDTCHAANVMGTRGSADITAVVNELASVESGVVVFTAATGRQDALEDPKWKNGAFTKALVEGVNGGADKYSRLGTITVDMLALYITEQVKELTKGKQKPATQKPELIPDFPIAVVQ